MPSRARQITNWADTIEARQTLPVLLRRLIHATGDGLRRVDVPGYDNSQRPGWDGWVEADAATPWIPAGRSGWEWLETSIAPQIWLAEQLAIPTDGFVTIDRF